MSSNKLRGTDVNLRLAIFSLSIMEIQSLIYKKGEQNFMMGFVLVGVGLYIITAGIKKIIEEFKNH